MSLELPAIARIAAALAVALLISFVATPIVKALAQRMGAVDVPKDNRRMHDHPIPVPEGDAAGRSDHRDLRDAG